MNRRYRRATAKQEKESAADYAPDGVTPTVPIVAKQEAPGLLLRLVASILLSSWVLKRVHHSMVLGILGHLAGQVGRTDALVRIHEKLRQGQ